jgi:hypothetical protein
MFFEGMGSDRGGRGHWDQKNKERDLYEDEKNRRMRDKRYQTLEEFWPYYVREHSNPLTRELHFIGNTNLFLWLLLALLRRSPKLGVFAVASSYAVAWIGHFFVEQNRPATFRYPIWSAICDMVMYVKMWRGEMDAEVEKYIHDQSA